eukprot:15359910-Ditylum_brightwellii.AAC.1
MPCDLSSDDYTWNYDGVPTSDFEMKLEPAPQFEMKKYEKPTNGCGPIQGTMIKPRLKEYESLYPNETVPESWWGWKFFNVLYNNKTMKES